MLRLGSVLLAGLLVLSGCGSNKSAEADKEFLKACMVENIGGWPYFQSLEPYLVEASKLNPDYQEYLESYLSFDRNSEVQQPFWAKFQAKCLMLKS